MSLQKTKAQLIQLLDDPDYKVIALSGLWGTGKTHLWEEIKQQSANASVSNALYVSLFGVSSMDQVLNKLIQSAARDGKIDSLVSKTAKSTFKGLESFHKGFATINELCQLLAVSMLLRKKIVVIDDIERMHEKLSIDEILGFIDDYSKNREVRFVLILNSNKLTKRDQWSTLHEKVIDLELQLVTTPAEAFSIAIQSLPSAYASSLKRACVICKLTNIRIIKKVIKTTNRIFGQSYREDELPRKMIPSVVLLTAIHHRGLENGPTKELTLSWKPQHSDFLKLFPDTNHWKDLVNQLGIYITDDFEHHVIAFLQTGHFDPNLFESIITKNVAEHARHSAIERVEEVREALYWDHRLDSNQARTRVDEVLASDQSIPPDIYNGLVKIVRDTPCIENMAQLLIDRWIDLYKQNPQPYSSGSGLEPAIIEAIEHFNAQRRENTAASFAEQLIQFAQAPDHQRYNSVVYLNLCNTGVEYYESAIRDMPIKGLQGVLPYMLDAYNQSQRDNSTIEAVAQRLIAACRNLYRTHASEGLGRLLKRQFAYVGLDIEHMPQPSVTTNATAGEPEH
ncbi:hypothetical protein HNQ59_000824 [Chitinivorax tropicus]|uniref:ORC1/DEAH AAA+ ATPase domain-containing protein n=1 Tax=Chitinivorax tropicus TaxID=714531 RepID=A0A840MJ70_9PROT|nr:AAA family ATPase [Chitinivorax tropicus]MBB5017555.1 hypothetical protein [Chitinivorax tropicus]